jgi:hypothetical protein
MGITPISLLISKDATPYENQCWGKDKKNFSNFSISSENLVISNIFGCCDIPKKA